MHTLDIKNGRSVVIEDFDLSTIRHVKLTVPVRGCLRRMLSLESVQYICEATSHGFEGTVDALLHLLATRASLMITATAAVTEQTGTTSIPSSSHPARLKAFKLKQHPRYESSLDSHLRPLIRFLNSQNVGFELRIPKLGFYSADVLKAIKTGRLCPSFVVLHLGLSKSEVVLVPPIDDQGHFAQRRKLGISRRKAWPWAFLVVLRLVAEATVHMTQLETLNLKMLELYRREDMYYASHDICHRSGN
ncbi:hypothetical protein HK102_013718 [Quaeritorhiza haematococci]|nr:hypothetical protein HK102_013718 [Quaeritorhiza haematococci]